MVIKQQKAIIYHKYQYLPYLPQFKQQQTMIIAIHPKDLCPSSKPASLITTLHTSKVLLVIDSATKILIDSSNGIRYSTLSGHLNVSTSNIKKQKALDNQKHSQQYKPFLNSQNGIERIKEKEDIGYNYAKASYTKSKNRRIKNISRYPTKFHNSFLESDKKTPKQEPNNKKLEKISIYFFKSLITKVCHQQIAEIVKRKLYLHLPEQSKLKIRSSEIDQRIKELYGQSKTPIWSDFVRPLMIFWALTNFKGSKI